MAAYLGIFLDIAVLVFLGGTIFFAINLTQALGRFRAHRQEMNNLVRELSRNVDAATRAIRNLKEAGTQENANLQERIKTATELHEELQIITKTAENLAGRLEGVSVASAPPQKAVDEVDAKASSKVQDKKDIPSFFIKDKDQGETAVPSSEDPDLEVPSNLQSKAEQELYKALQKNKKATK